MTALFPFRADIVGSFLRPGNLKHARAERAAHRLDQAAFHEIETAAITDLIAKQSEVGLAVATDGEFPRAWWQFDFFGSLNGVEIVELDHGIKFTGIETRPHGIHIGGRIGFDDRNPGLDQYRLVQDVTAKTTHAQPKFTIPSPTVFDFRLEADQIDSSVYADRDAFADDLVQAYRDALAAFYAAGCRYLQFDDTTWAYLCSEAELEKSRERGIHVEGLADRYTQLVNRVLEGKPDDLVVTTHVCRGNFRSTWIASGGYEPVAEQLFNEVNYDGYFLEYDSDRAGGFEPLRFLPEGDKTVVLGLITSKSGELEDVDAIKRRIDEATEFAPLDQLALSAQCGFASTEEGNTLTEEQQWAKVREIVNIAEDVWK